MGKNNINLVICAIVCITFLEAIALSNGINGTIFKIVLAAIAGFVGLVIPTPKLLRVKVNGR